MKRTVAKKAAQTIGGFCTSVVTTSVCANIVNRLRPNPILFAMGYIGTMIIGCATFDKAGEYVGKEFDKLWAPDVEEV